MNKCECCGARWNMGDNQWIKCSDRLPEKENTYIVCLINNYPVLCNVHDATFSLTSNRVSFYWPTSEWVKDELYGDVTHWMPLPEMPN